MFDITFTVRDWDWQSVVMQDAVLMTIGSVCGSSMRLRIISAIKVFSFRWIDV